MIREMIARIPERDIIWISHSFSLQSTVWWWRQGNHCAIKNTLSPLFVLPKCLRASKASQNFPIASNNPNSIRSFRPNGQRSPLHVTQMCYHSLSPVSPSPSSSSCCWRGVARWHRQRAPRRSSRCCWHTITSSRPVSSWTWSTSSNGTTPQITNHMPPPPLLLLLPGEWIVDPCWTSDRWRINCRTASTTPWWEQNHL